MAKEKGGILPSWMWNPAVVLGLVGEVILNWIIIKRVPYTEIDWEAYMDQVGPTKGYLSGQWNYTMLEGPTGPCVYPAGHVYLMSIANILTNFGADIHMGQILWAVMYLVFICSLYLVYKQTRRFGPEVLLLLSLSRRIHSIFVLRLFNDCLSMTLLYIAILFLINKRWGAGCVVFSFAVSIKMNILLFAPAVGFLMLKAIGFRRTILHVLLCAFIQVVLALPFLLVNPWGYVSRSFDFGRQFIHFWSVNLKFLPPHIFNNTTLAKALLLMHLVALFLFVWFKWCKEDGGLFGMLSKAWRDPQDNLSPDYMVYTLFTSNFIGVVFARSLHFQFFLWYFHALPYLLFSTKLPKALSVVLIVGVEVIWNIFPSNPITSASLTAIHLVILVLLAFTSSPPPSRSTK